MSRAPTTPRFLSDHLSRIRQGSINKLGRKDLAAWIERNTFINGKPFSFSGHEYQSKIIGDDSQHLVIRKSAQTGISEMSLRMTAGLMMVMPGAYAVGYVLPSASFATSYAQTRFNPIVQGSAALRYAISRDDIDRADIKSFGPGKLVYFKGAAVGNAAISTSLDLIIADEMSFCDQEVLSDFTSRLIHSPYKHRISLSTPTFPGDPIDTAFNASRRHFNMCRCEHCDHTFLPDYYEHVSVPGWRKGLDEITKQNLHQVRYKEAKLLCPHCGVETSLQPEHREWVCENPTEGHTAAGYQVSPFDAPNVVTLADLILASTQYASKSKFQQFSLGQPAANAEDGLTEADIEAIGFDSETPSSGAHVMGIDLGQICHFTVGRVGPDGELVVVHVERVPLKNFRARYWGLKASFRVSVVVSDLQPYTDLIMSLSAEDPSLYGATYVSRQGMEVYSVRDKVADFDSAIEGVRQVSVSRNQLFDRLLVEIRDKRVRIRRTEDWQMVKQHLTDMKRASATLRNGEFTSIWQKSSKGQDHMHHSLGYLWVAAQMRGVAAGAMVLGTNLVSTFKLTGPKPVRQGTGIHRG